ncbi:hypothetical protein QYE76_011492 [Lolium multiflorum]|uniref:CCHC-type domain-containing protein n=1 Tax=Lolium multiflorum TaxID=4521 RepID=A0AAD8TVG2_LOLMU|nr:hypothetical protein QYE76_011492 [Lolium multiflorum]
MASPSINFNQFLEKEKLKSNGSNFTDWFRHVRIFLNGGNLQYVLEAPLGSPPPPAVCEEEKNVFETRTKVYSQVQCAILCSLEAELQKHFEHHDPCEMIRELKVIFETHATVESYEASKQFFGCMMEEGSSVSEHVFAMSGHARKLSDLGINMNKELPELFSMLKSAEVEIQKEHQVLMVNKTTKFKKQGKPKKDLKKGGKKAAAHPEKPKGGPKPDTDCYYCNGKGHWKRNCSKYLADLKSGLVKKKKGMEHWTAVKNILKYLKRTKDMFLCYGGDQELIVTSYTDASWNTDPDDSKSQSGYVFILNGAAVSWCSSKQCTVAKSSTESEYIAASEASSEAVWMKRFIVELGVVPSALDPLVIYCDNMGAIANAQEPRSHKKLNHIKLRFHSIREYIEDGEIMASPSINFNQFLEKEKLKSNGSNFTDWFRHVRIFLNGGNLQYVLEAPLGSPPPPAVCEEEKNVFETRTKVYSQVQCAILCSLEAELQKRFEHHDPCEMIRELKVIFETHAAVESYEASKQFFGCMMEEGSSVSEHVFAMSGHARKLSDLGIVIPNQLGIHRVLQSLPPSYKNFVMNYNMQNMNKELPELFSMLKSAEVEIQKEHQVLMVNKTTKFKKQGKPKKDLKKGGKKAAAHPEKPKGGPKPDTDCYYCNGKGH